MKYNIEKATIEDAKDLNHFLTLLIKDEKKYDDNINGNCVINEMYENLIEMENNCCLVIKNENRQNCGYLFGFICNKGDAYIKKTAQLDAMYVLEEYRKNGLGVALVEEFKKWAKEKEVKIIQLTVCDQNINACSLYEKNGFRITKRWEELYIEE